MDQETEVRTIDSQKWVSHLAYQNLQEEYDAVRKEADEMRRNKNMTDVEVEELTRIRTEHGAMRERLNELTVFMRTNYAKEIALGQHNNMKDSVDAAMFYMGRERIISRGAVVRRRKSLTGGEGDVVETI